MAKRYKMDSKRSKRMFRETASRSHKFNAGSRPVWMRGGIRL